MKWEDMTRWAWRPKRITRRQYPSHGTDVVTGGKLTGSTETDYFHFDCPKCGAANPYGLDVELLGVHDVSGPQSPNAKNVVFGLGCPLCGLRDLVKIGCLESEEYQPRRMRFTVSGVGKD